MSKHKEYQEAFNVLDTRECREYNEHNQAAKLIQELVDKETPMKIKDLELKTVWTKNDYIVKAYCPNCGSKFIDYEKDKNITGIYALYTKNNKHCKNCGQALEWGE